MDEFSHVVGNGPHVLHAAKQVWHALRLKESASAKAALGALVKDNRTDGAQHLARGRGPRPVFYLLRGALSREELLMTRRRTHHTCRPPFTRFLPSMSYIPPAWLIAEHRLIAADTHCCDARLGALCMCLQWHNQGAVLEAMHHIRERATREERLCKRVWQAACRRLATHPHDAQAANQAYMAHGRGSGIAASWKRCTWPPSSCPLGSPPTLRPTTLRAARRRQLSWWRLGTTWQQ